MSSQSNRRSGPSGIDRFCEGIIEAGWLVTALVVPVFFLVGSDRPFDPSKATVIRALAATGGSAWLVKVLTGGRPWRPVPSDAAAASTALARWLLSAVALSSVALVVSTLLSVDPWLSWHGSYDRGIGVSTGLAVIVLFFLVVGHLRDSRQLELWLGVVWWGSVPVCLYALLQDLGLDPVTPGLPPLRPGSSLGNPIFLAAYLGFAFFLGLALLETELRRGSDGAWDGFRQGVVTSVCGLQLWALLTASSRGPVLGVLGGLVLLAWMLLARGDWRRVGVGGRREWRDVLVVGVLILLVGAAIPTLRHPEASLNGEERSATRRDRLAGLADPGSRNARVRLLVWQGALDALTSPSPLPSAFSEDRRRAWRPWVGYGCDAAGYALGRYEPLELARLEPERTPDNAHNRILQTAVSGGVTGLVAWGLVQMLVLAVAATAFGLLRRPAELTMFVVFVLSGGAVGGAALWAGMGEPSLAALGGVAGVLAAFTIWMTRLWWASPARGSLETRGLTVSGGVLFAAWVSHVIESQFGIRVTTVMVFEMMTLAVFVVVASGWMGSAESDRHHPRKVGDLGELATTAALVSMVLTTVFLLTPQYQVGSGWFRTGNQQAAIWLVLASVAAGSALIEDGRRSAAVAGGGIFGWLGASVLFKVSRAAQVDGIASASASAAQAEARFLAIVLGAVVVAAIVLGWRIARTRAADDPRPSLQIREARRIRVAIAGVCCGLVVFAGWFVESRRLRSSMLVRGAMSLASSRHFAAATDTLGQARRLCPGESRLALMQGRVGFDWALAATEPAVRDGAMRRARAGLGEALELSPFQADHVVNLGRWHVAKAEFEGQPFDRDSELSAAEALFERAIEMRPSHLSWHRELADVLRRLGNLDRAVAILEAVRETLVSDTDLVLDLAELRLAVAARADSTGDSLEARANAREALILTETVANDDLQSGRAQRMSAVARRLLGDVGS